MSPIRAFRKVHPLIYALGILVLLVAVFGIPAPAHARTWVVNSLWDDDDGVCDETHCTLREAINAARSGDIIWIGIASGSPNWVIYLDSELPPITGNNITIDGTSMPPFLGGPSVVLVGDEDIDYGFRLDGNHITIRGFKFSSFWGSGGGAGVVITGNHNVVEGNCFNNSTYGILVNSDENVIRDNYVGVMPWGSASPNDEVGILIDGSENDLENNVIAYNGAEGIAFSTMDNESFNNTFTHNSIYENGGLGIVLGENNGGVDMPYLTDVSLTEVSGEACAGCTVELFLAAPDPTDYGEGQTFIGEGVVGADRTFTIALDESLEECDPVTATVTDTYGDTSEFALNERAGLCMSFEMPPLVEPYLTVNTVDDMDDGVCDEDHCSLREAINYANSHLGRDTISFDIPGPGPHEIILPLEPFPMLTNDQTTIDGTSEPDYAGSPVVWLVNDDSTYGLWVESQRNTIRGLGITGFDFGIRLNGGFNRLEDNVINGNGHGISIHSNHNTLTGNIVGLNAAGDAAVPNVNGINVCGDDQQIGLPGAGNIISGNEFRGLTLRYSFGTEVMGNIIGADASGTTAIPNGAEGIQLRGDATIGGLGAGEGNIIFGNGGNGIYLYDIARDSVIAGNIIAENGGYGIYNDSLDEGFFTITQNSIYDNGELGIETNRADDHIADLDRASMTSVSGTVDCRGCTVEVFQAAPDPTGFGEGRTYLGETTTNVGGAFTFEFSGLAACDELTVTVTDGDGNTSNFSENALVACMRAPGRPMSVFGFAGILVLTIVVVVLGELGPETPPWLVPAVAGGGLLILAVAFGVLWALPGVQLDFGPPSAPPPDPIPWCGEYIDPDGYEPSGQVLIGMDEDPVLTWKPGPDAPEGAQWSVELISHDQQLYTLTTTETSVPLSDFQVEPRAGGRFIWRVRLLSEGEAACRPAENQTLTFENPLMQAVEVLPEIEEDEPAEEEPVEEEPVEEACTPSVTAVMNANCRYGPGSVYDELDYLMEGETADALGRSADWAWWYVRLMDSQQMCWVWDGAVEAECTDQLPVIAAPPTPTPLPPEEDTTPPPTPSPQQPTGGVTLGCSSSTMLIWSTVSDPSGIANYTVEVQRSPDQVNWSGAPGSPVTTTADKTTISVECGWYYRWRVRATDGEGNVGSYSGWATFSITLN